MICKSCGTECASEVCTHCGAKMINEAFAPEGDSSMKTVASASEVAIKQEPSTVPPAAEQPQEGKPAREPRVKHRKRRERVENEHLGEKIYISFESIFFPILFLLLPICYLFFDLFAVYSSSVFTVTEGTSPLLLLIAKLFSAASGDITASALIMETVGDSFVGTVTVKAIFENTSASTALMAGAVSVVVIAVLCLVAAALLIVTWGRLLRQKLFADFVVGVSVLGALTPLIAKLVVRLLCENGDVAMQSLHLSVEAALLFGISLCLMLPAAKKLRRVAGGVRVGVYATLPYRFASRSTMISRILAIAFGVIGMALPFLAVFMGGISRGGVKMEDTASVLTASIGGIGDLAATVGTLFSGGNAFEVMTALADIFLLLMIVLMCCYTLSAFFALLKLIITGKDALVDKKRVRRAFDRMASRFRGAAIAVVSVTIVLHVLLMLVGLFLTNAFQYIDVFNVGETLSVIYALMAYTGTCLELNSFGCGLLLLSVLFATVGGNFARGIANRAGELGE